MGRLAQLACVAAVAAACGGHRHPPPPACDGGCAAAEPDAGPPDAGGPSLLVHAASLLALPDGGAAAPWVFVGDGAIFARQTNVIGDVQFSGAALAGPQTVTGVQRDPRTGALRAATVAEFEGHELFLPPRLPPAAGQWRATVSGQVTGFAASYGVTLVAAGPGGAYGSGQIDNAGNFSFDVYGDSPTPVDLAGYEVGGGGAMERVGVLRGLPLPALDVTLPLDVPCDQPLDVSFQSDGRYGAGPYEAYVAYYAPGVEVPLFSFFSFGSASPSFTLPTARATGELAGLARWAAVFVGSYQALPDGFTTAQRYGLDPAAGAVDLTALGPGVVTSPALGTSGSPASGAVAGFGVTWTADPAAQLAVIALSTAGPPALEWTVSLPASRGAFAFPALPAAAAPQAGLPAGRYALTLATWYFDSLPDFSAGFDGTFDRATLSEQRMSEVQGFVELH